MATGGEPDRFSIVRFKGITPLFCLVTLFFLTTPSLAEEGVVVPRAPLPLNTKIATLSHDIKIKDKIYPKGTTILQLTRENKDETIALIINASYRDLALKDEELAKHFEIAAIKISDIDNNTTDLPYEGKIKIFEASNVVAKFSDVTLNTSQFVSLAQPTFNNLEIRVIKPDYSKDFEFQIHFHPTNFRFTTSDPAICRIITEEPSLNGEKSKRYQGIAHFDSKIKLLREEQLKHILDVLSDFRKKDCKEFDDEKLKIALFDKLNKLEDQKIISRLQHESIVMGLTIHGEAGASTYGEPTRVAHMIAVGSVILNRRDMKAFSNSEYYPKHPETVMAVCTRWKQFSPWNPGKPRLREMICPELKSELEAQKLALKTAFQMLDSTQNANRRDPQQDPTGGSTHFYSPKAMKPEGTMPDWVPSLTEVTQVKVVVKTNGKEEEITIDPNLYKFYKPKLEK